MNFVQDLIRVSNESNTWKSARTVCLFFFMYLIYIHTHIRNETIGPLPNIWFEINDNFVIIYLSLSISLSLLCSCFGNFLSILDKSSKKFVDVVSRVCSCIHTALYRKRVTEKLRCRFYITLECMITRETMKLRGAVTRVWKHSVHSSLEIIRKRIGRFHECERKSRENLGHDFFQKCQGYFAR